MTSRTYSISLTANLRAQSDSGDPGLSFGYLAILLTRIVADIVAIICKNSPISRTFDLFWPPVTSNLTWSKNDLSIFCRTCRDLSNAVYLPLPLVAIFLSFRRWLRPPAMRGLTLAAQRVLVMHPSGFTKKKKQLGNESVDRNETCYTLPSNNFTTSLKISRPYQWPFS